MPGSEIALEELMCRVLGDCLQDGIVTCTVVEILMMNCYKTANGT